MWLLALCATGCIRYSTDGGWAVAFSADRQDGAPPVQVEVQMLLTEGPNSVGPSSFRLQARAQVLLDGSPTTMRGFANRNKDSIYALTLVGSEDIYSYACDRLEFYDGEFDEEEGQLRFSTLELLLEGDWDVYEARRVRFERTDDIDENSLSGPMECD